MMPIGNCSAPSSGISKTLVLGIGNDILSDDGAGIETIERLRKSVRRSDVAFETTSTGGFDFINILAGYDRAIIVDAIQTRQGKPGDCYIFSSSAFLPTHNLISLHEVDLFTAMDLGRRMGVKLPSEIIIVAIEAKDVYTFRETRSPEVIKGIERAMEIIVDRLPAEELCMKRD